MVDPHTGDGDVHAACDDEDARAEGIMCWVRVGCGTLSGCDVMLGCYATEDDASAKKGVAAHAFVSVTEGKGDE